MNSVRASSLQPDQAIRFDGLDYRVLGVTDTLQGTQLRVRPLGDEYAPVNVLHVRPTQQITVLR